MATKELSRPLTLKEQRFIKWYLELGNGAEAVRRAGYQLKSQNGSTTKLKEQETASSIATENLRKPAIRQAIDKAIVKQNISPESILSRINNIADNSNADRDRLRALELLGKAYKLFTETDQSRDVNITLTLGRFNGEIVGDIEGEIVDSKDTKQLTTTD